MTNRANGILTGYGFTVFRLLKLNSPTGLRILQAVIQHASLAEIAALQRFQKRRAEIEKSASVTLPDYLLTYLQEVYRDVIAFNQHIAEGEATLLAKIGELHLVEQVNLMCSVPGITQILARRMAEALWWVMTRHEPYRYWTGEAPRSGTDIVALGELLVNPDTGELLNATEGVTANEG